MARNAKVEGRNPFGPQEPQADLSENIGESGLPTFYECGVCGNDHPLNWNGDCRDDNNRFTADELDAKYGENKWTELRIEDPEHPQHEDEDEN